MAGQARPSRSRGAGREGGAAIRSIDSLMGVKSSLKEALKHLASGDASACEDSCLSLLKTKEGKNNANALVLLGKSQFLLNRPWRALKACAKALELDPNGVQDKACKGITEASTILYCEGADSDGADRLEATKLVTDANAKLLSSFGPGDHYKWHDQHVAFVSFLGRVGAPAQDVLLAWKAGIEREGLPVDLRVSVLRGYVDLSSDGKELVPLLEELCDLGGDFEGKVGYRRRHFRSLLLARDWDGARRVAAALIGRLEDDDFVASAAVDLWAEEPVGSREVDVASEGRFPCDPLSPSQRRMCLRLAHLRPWSGDRWTKVASVAFQDASLCAPWPARRAACGGTSTFASRVARRFAQEKVKRDPNCAAGWDQLCLCFCHRDPEKSLRCLEKSLGCGDRTALRLCLRGMLLRASGRPERAAEAAEEASREAPKGNGGGFALLSSRCLSLSLMDLGEWGRAAEVLRDVLKRVAPGNPRSESDLGWCLHKMRRGDGDGNRVEEAMTMIERAAAALPGEAKHAYRLGRAMWHRGGRHREDRSLAYAWFLRAASGTALAAGATSKDADEALEVQSKAFRSLGEWYLRVARDEPRALRCYRKSLRLSPRRVGAGKECCRLLAEAGRREEVVEVCEAALEALPGDAEVERWALLPLALALSESGDHRRAIPAFQRSIRVCRRDGLGAEMERRCWEGLGLGYHEDGRHQSAAKAFEHVLSAPWGGSQSAFSLARLAAIHSEHLLDHQGALALRRRALDALNGTRDNAAAAPVAMGAAVDLLNQSRKLTRIGAKGAAASAASMALLELERTDGGRGRGPRAAAGRAKLRGDLDLALEDPGGAGRGYVRALHAEPYLAARWHDLALARHALGEEEGAAKLAMRGLAVCPTDPALWAALGEVLEEVAAKEYCLCRSLQLQPSNADAWVLLASLYLNKGASELAIECLQNARTHRPGCAPAWECEGALRCALDESHDASETFEYALRLSNTAYANRRYAAEVVCAEEVGEDDLRRARVSAVLSLESGRDDPAGLLCAAIVSERLKLHAEAVGYLERALRESPGPRESGEIRKALARNWMKVGEIERAREVYEGFVGQQDFPWDEGTRRAALLSGCEGVPVVGEDAELRAKLDLRRRLTESGVKEGLRMAEEVEEGWLMVLILEARSSEAALEAALAASKASRSWAAISTEATRIAAAGRAKFGDARGAARLFARAAHASCFEDPASYLSLLSPGCGALLRLEGALDLRGPVFRLLKARRREGGGGAEGRRLLAKCRHRWPQSSVLWE